MNPETITLLVGVLFFAFSILISFPQYQPPAVLIPQRPTWNSPPSFPKKRQLGHLFRKTPNAVARGRGKRKGSPGGGRKRPAPAEWDRTVHVVPQWCDRVGCGALLPDIDHDTYSRFVIDLTIGKKRIQGETSRYVVHRKWCPRCGALVSGNSLVSAFPHHRFGYGFLTAVMFKRVGLKMPLARIMEDLGMFMPPSDLCSPTSISNWVKSVARNLEPLYQELITLMKKNSYLYVDETGLPLDGKRWWMWVLATKLVAIYHASETRGHEGIKELVRDYAGILVTDFWTAYEKLSQKQQKCLVHLLRDLMDVMVRALKKKKRWWKRLAEAKEFEVQKRWEKGGRRRRGRPKKLKELSEEEQDRARRELERLDTVVAYVLEVLDYFRKVDKENLKETEAVKGLLSLLDRAPGGEEVRKLVKRMRKYHGQLFVYVEACGTEMKDNNEVERDIKEFAVLRRAVGCLRSPALAKSYAVWLSILVTCKKVGLRGYEVWRALVRNRWEGIYHAIQKKVNQGTSVGPG